MQKYQVRKYLLLGITSSGSTAKNQSVSNYAFTVLDGANYGGKILVSDGRSIWQSVKDISFTLPSSITNGIHEISGQKFYAESLNNSAKIIICGAGNIALSVIRLARFPVGFGNINGIKCADSVLSSRKKSLSLSVRLISAMLLLLAYG